MANRRRLTASDATRRKQATIFDVAKAASVSAMTVSRAVSGRGRIAKSTKERILTAARKLAYTPSPLARGLQGLQTRTIGLVAVTISQYPVVVERTDSIENHA